MEIPSCCKSAAAVQSPGETPWVCYRAAAAGLESKEMVGLEAGAPFSGIWGALIFWREEEL